MNLTTAELLDLPATCSLADACRALGMSKTVGYEQVRTGEFPVPIMRVGRNIKVPRAGILQLLGVEEPPPSESDSLALLREIADCLGQLVSLLEAPSVIHVPAGEQAAAEMLQVRGWHVVPPRSYRGSQLVGS